MKIITYLVTLLLSTLVLSAENDPLPSQHYGFYFETEKGPWIQSTEGCDIYGGIIGGLVAWVNRLSPNAVLASIDIAFTGTSPQLQELLKKEFNYILKSGIETDLPAAWNSKVSTQCKKVEGRSWLFERP
jgi:hypothetical protein